MVEKPFSGGLGDIQNYPRKKKLLRSVKEEVRENAGREISFDEVIVFGSWGKGTAIPFSSDIDILVKTENPQGGDLDTEYLEDMEDMDEHFRINGTTFSDGFPIFNGGDIIIAWDDSIFNQTKINTEGENRRAYDLIEMEVVSI